MTASSGRRSIYFGGAAVLCSLPVLAAEVPANADDESRVQEVVVTAQKREERSIDVPVVINSVKAEDLATQNLSGIRDYYSRVPGLAYDGNKTYNLSLRGVTTGNATNPTLAILLDDVQFGASTVAGLGNSLFPDFDPSILERIEVLHGPQGTLYGAASLGGLIKFVTRQPDTTNFSARLEAGVQSVKGGDTGWGARGTVNIPLIADKMALRVSGFNREDPAYIDNIHAGLEGKDVNSAHIRGGHASLLFKPIDNLSITLSALQQKRDADFSPSTRVNADANNVPTYAPLFGKDTVDLAATSDIGDQKLYSGRIVFDVGGVEFTSITAYGKSAGTNFQDVSSVFAFLGAPPFYNLPGISVSIDDVAHTNKFSQELRLSGTAGKMDWRTGLFYTREKSSVDQALQVFDPSGAFLATAYDGLGPNSYRERAIFGDVVFHLTEQWDLQAGARYAKNKQASGGSVIIDGPAQPAFGPSGVNPDLASRDNSTTWALSPIYHITPDLMAYLRVATGYRPGGPNTVITGVPPSFAPDKVTNYEVGFKGILADRTFSWEAAVFQIDWRDVQLQDTAANQFTYTTNGGKARSRGAEVAFDWRPVPGLNVYANVSALDATLTQTLPLIPDAETLVGDSGDRLPSSAKLSSNLSVQQDFAITDQWSAFLGANWAYVGSRRSSFSSTLAQAPRFSLPSYSLIDLRAGINYGSDLHLNLFVRNATNKRGVISADNRNGTNIGGDGVPVTFVNFLQPRTIGVSVAKEF